MGFQERDPNLHLALSPAELKPANNSLEQHDCCTALSLSAGWELKHTIAGQRSCTCFTLAFASVLQGIEALLDRAETAAVKRFGFKIFQREQVIDKFLHAEFCHDLFPFSGTWVRMLGKMVAQLSMIPFPSGARKK